MSIAKEEDNERKGIKRKRFSSKAFRKTAQALTVNTIFVKNIITNRELIKIAGKVIDTFPDIFTKPFNSYKFKCVITGEDGTGDYLFEIYYGKECIFEYGFEEHLVDSWTGKFKDVDDYDGSFRLASVNDWSDDEDEDEDDE